MKVDCEVVSPSPADLSSISSDSLVETPPLPQCKVCVVVPVRNEAKMLEGTLSALAHQVDAAGRSLDPTSYEIIVLANNCEDDSAAIARQFARQHSIVLHVVERSLPASDAHIGWVRKALMDEAYHRLCSIEQRQGIIASTDGDTRVAPNWIAAIAAEIDRGADAVGGRIITDRSDRIALAPYARACHLHEVGYRFLVAELEAHLDPDAFDVLPRHFQHYGASLAVTADLYERAGGMPLVRSSEDVALYKALMRVDARFRHSLQVRVTTSARQVGRAQQGLADQLREWTAMGEQKQPFWVESAAAIALRFQARHALRSIWQQLQTGTVPSLESVTSTACQLGIAEDWLWDELQRQAFFGELVEQVEHRQAQAGSWHAHLVKIEQAIDDLRQLLEPLRQSHRKAADLANHALRQRAQTNPADIFQRDRPSGALAQRRAVPKTNHAPDRRSADCRSTLHKESSERAADVPLAEGAVASGVALF